MKGCVVIIDDERGSAEGLRAFLAEAGYDAVAPDVRQLSTALADIRPSVFIVDVILRDTSGIEIVAYLRSRGYSAVPMIGTSASPALARQAEETGMFAGVLEKPLSNHDLLLRLGTLLGGDAP